MLLSKQQRYVLDVLRRLGCARKNQLEALLKARFFPPEKAVPPGFLDAMLRQFRCGDVEVRRQGDVIFLTEKAPDARLLEAIDVMLELSGAVPSDFWAEAKGAVLLRFSVAGRRIKPVRRAPRWRPHRPRRALAPAVSRAERVVVLLSGGGPRRHCPSPTRYFTPCGRKTAPTVSLPGKETDMTGGISYAEKRKPYPNLPLNWKWSPSLPPKLWKIPLLWKLGWQRTPRPCLTGTPRLRRWRRAHPNRMTQRRCRKTRPQMGRTWHWSRNPAEPWSRMPGTRRRRRSSAWSRAPLRTPKTGSTGICPCRRNRPVCPGWTPPGEAPADFPEWEQSPFPDPGHALDETVSGTDGISPPAEGLETGPSDGPDGAEVPVHGEAGDGPESVPAGERTGNADGGPPGAAEHGVRDDAAEPEPPPRRRAARRTRRTAAASEEASGPSTAEATLENRSQPETTQGKRPAQFL